MLQYIKTNTTMSKYNVYANSECVWEGDDYDVALQEYTDCINDYQDGSQVKKNIKKMLKIGIIFGSSNFFY
jgi:hypothetical protein